ncbi:MAG: DUF4169 family protein [Rickettsiales bacterium]
MAEIFNLRQQRKNKARTAKEKKAEQNRALHGRTKAEKQKKKLEDARMEQLLDGHKRDTKEDHEAFTLLEISIVLVVIALVVGGVFAGRNLIKAAEVRSVAAEMENYKTTILIFRDKYMALPGDMRNATQLWGRADGGTPVTQNCASPDTDIDAANPTATCNGNGDGKITASTVTVNNTEIFRIWQHLANAGLIEGRYTGVGGTLNAATNWRKATLGVNTPMSKMSGSGYFIAYSALASACSAPNKWTGGETANAYQYIAFGKESALALPWNSNLSPAEAYMMDVKLDDGRPGLGKFTTSCANICSDGTVAETANYLPDDLDKVCAATLRFK